MIAAYRRQLAYEHALRACDPLRWGRMVCWAALIGIVVVAGVGI